MLVVPLGVEAKTVDTPWATISIVVLVCLYSVLNINLHTKATNAYIGLPERRAYHHELKNYLTGLCPTVISAEPCGAFQKHIPAEFVTDPQYLRSMLWQKVTPEEFIKIQALITPFADEENVLRFSNTEPGIEPVVTKLKQARVQTAALLKSRRLFSVQNLDPVALVRAQFLHSGWTPLLGNILLLLLLALPVEQRLGGIKFVGVYLLTGATALLAHVFFGSTQVFIMGASANVFGIAGAFLAFFLKERMRIWMSLFFLHSQTVIVSVGLYFVAWVALAQAFTLLDLHEVSVGYLAQIMSFLLGFGICAFYKRFEKLPSGTVYPYEKEYLIGSERTNKPVKLFQLFIQWQNLNPSSVRASVGILVAGRMMMKSEAQHKSLSRFLELRWTDVFQQNLLNPDFIAKVPLVWLGSADLQSDSASVMKALDVFKNAEAERAEWVLLLYILWGRNERGFPELHQRFQQLCLRVFRESDFVEFVQEGASQSPHLADFLSKTGLWLGVPKANYG